jgi:hypothetical protein
MKSRRRIASPKGSGVHRLSLTASDYSRDLRLAEWGLTLHFAWQQSVGPNVRYGSLAAAARSKWGVRFTPESGLKTAVAECSAAFLMQLSFALSLCLIDLKTEQQERDDRVVVHASRPMGARHRTPDSSSPTR